jgi:uncharacterized protein YjbI with pentapeptide repeats
MPVADPTHLAVLDMAVAVRRARVLGLGFVVFAALLLATAGTVTHRQLLLESSIRLPLLSCELPQLAFFVAAPLLLLVFHLIILLRLHDLARKANACQRLLREQVEDRAVRARARRRLAAFSLPWALVGREERRRGVMQSSQRLVVWVASVMLPLTTLLALQLTFLPFHSQPVTWLHRVAVVVDLLLIWTFCRRISHSVTRAPGRRASLPAPTEARGAWTIYSGRRCERTSRALALCRRAWQQHLRAAAAKLHMPLLTPGRGLSSLASLALALFSLFVAVSPSEPIYSWTGKLAEIAFAGSVDIGNGRSNTPPWLANRLILADQDLGAGVKFTPSSQAGPGGRAVISLRGRDLVGAVLDRVDLRQADLSGAKLARASFVGARLDNALFACTAAGAHPQCAQLQGADFDRAQMRGAVLQGASLQGASLQRAQLQGATLADAMLQGARLYRTHLAGASLKRADLTGALLDYAELQGATLEGAAIRGATLVGTQLQGASLNSANLAASVLDYAQLQGVLLDPSDVHGASFFLSHVYRAYCSGNHPFHRCERVKSLLAESYVDVGAPALMPYLYLEAGEGIIIAADQQGFAKLSGSAMVGIASAELQATVRGRLSVLNPDARQPEDDRRDTEAWQATNTRSASRTAHLKSRMGVLQQAICHEGLHALALQGMGKNFASAAASRGDAGGDEVLRDCPGAAQLSGDERRPIVALFQLLTDEIRQAETDAAGAKN